MTEQFKKLAMFAMIFALSAVIIYIYLDARGPEADAFKDVPGAMDNDHTQMLADRIEQLKQELNNNPNNLQIINQIGHSYYDLGQPLEAIKYYERSLALEPHDAAVLTDCSVMYYNSGNADKALEYLDRAIELKPTLAQAWFNKGIILMSAKNDHKQAIEVWKKYIEIDPESEQAKFIKSQIDAIESEG